MSSQTWPFVREVVVPGRGDLFNIPIDFCKCHVTVEFVEPKLVSNAYRRKLFSFEELYEQSLDRTSSSVRIGDGCSSADILLERCLKTMRTNETCFVQFPVSIDENGAIMNKVGCPLIDTFELKLRLTLESFDRPSPAALWDMNSEQLLAEALRLKKRGVELYVENKARWAFRLFNRSLRLLIAIDDSSLSLDADRRQMNALCVHCYSNIAACQLLGANYDCTVISCTKALALDARNAKCLYRRAIALTGLQRYEEALTDLNAILGFDKYNAAAIRQKEIVLLKLHAHEKALSESLRTMFN